MPELSVEALLAGLRKTSVAEWVAVAAGVVYIVFIIRRKRLGWLMGGISSSIFVVLCLRSKLPMQALLQASYVAGAVYGWWSWAPDSQPQRDFRVADSQASRSDRAQRAGESWTETPAR